MLLYVIYIIEFVFSMWNSESNDCAFKSKAIRRVRYWSILLFLA